VLAGPEYRLVVDLGDPDAMRTVLTTGQSGQPGSPHYTDHLDPWLAGEYHALPFSPAAIEVAKVGEARLEPRS
jgi:acyl-homoserine lactone acylase PvdQ